MKRVFLIVAVGALRLFGTDFVVPPGVPDVTGPYPFGHSDMRYQQVYSSGAFSSLTPVGGGWITAMAFRLSGGALIDFTGNAQINFSTTERSVDGLSTVFAENVGSDDLVVVGSSDTIVFLNTPGSPAGVGNLITLTTPFFYNPAAGNLLMDVRMYRGLVSSVEDDPIRFAASNLPDDGSSALASFGRDSLTGIPDTTSLVTGFRITPVPEPSVTTLAITALLTAFVFSFRQKHKSPTRKE